MREFDITDRGASPLNPDNTEIIMDTMRAASTNGGPNGGGVVVVPVGEFLCHDIEHMSGVHLMGESVGHMEGDRSILKSNENSTHGLVWSKGQPRQKISNLCLDGNGAEYTGNGLNLASIHAWAYDMERVVIERCTEHGFLSSGANAITAKRCSFQGGDKGLVLINESFSWHIDDSIFQYGGVTSGLPYALKAIGTSTHNVGQVSNSHFEFGGDDTAHSTSGNGRNNIQIPVVCNQRNMKLDTNLFSVGDPENDNVQYYHVQIAANAHDATLINNNFSVNSGGELFRGDVNLLEGAAHLNFHATDGDTLYSSADKSTYTYSGTHRTYAGSPTNKVLPVKMGEELWDSLNNKWYKSFGITNTEWSGL